MIRVDGNVYTWMGDPNGPPVVNQTGFAYTSTKSIFVMDVEGKVEMTITFTSPLTPDDLKRQSLVFSFMEVSVKSLDGASHNVQLYSDISAGKFSWRCILTLLIYTLEWVTGDHGAIAQWDIGLTKDNIAYHKVWRQEQLPFSSTNEQADWGNWYFATSDEPNLTVQTGADVIVRGQFQSSGSLADTKDWNFRPINQDWPVFGFASDLGNIKNPVSTLYTLGLTQEQAIQFDGKTGIVPLHSLWTSYFSSELDAVSFFYSDYPAACSAASDFDQRVETDSVAAGGADYLTITSISAREAFGAVQLVGNSTKQYLFLKEISSDGNVQTVDVIFPFHPILLYTNPSLLKLLLDPLFENQESGHYPNTYSMHDLGGSYPNATGHRDGNDERQPLEECGNMLIMTLAYSQHTKDTGYLATHYNILKQWTQYLIAEALIPADQISTDDFAGSLANQTNLALKGIIGIGAMAQIANLTGHMNDAQNYSTIARSYVSQWQTYGINYNATPPHTMLAYNSPASHGMLYNLYADALLSLDLIPQSVYDIQSAFYPTVMDEYGLPLDTRHEYTKSDWEMFTAAVASESTKELLVKALARFVGGTSGGLPMTDLYDAPSGGWPVDMGHFTARPVVGGHFALLGLPT